MIIFTQQIVLQITEVKFLLSSSSSRALFLTVQQALRTQLYPLSSDPVKSRDTLSQRILQFNSFMSHLLQKFALTDLRTGFAYGKSSNSMGT